MSHYLDILANNHLYIQEVTTLDVDPDLFFEDSTDPDNYVDNNTVDSYLQLVDKDGNTLVTGDDEEIKDYLKNNY